MSLLLLFGCGVTVRPTCTETRTDISDDDAAALGFSAAELVNPIAGEQVSPGEWEDGTPVDVTVGVARGEGSAVLVRQEHDSIRTPNGELFGESVLMVHVECNDYVEVPVDFSVRTADGAADFLATAMATGTIATEARVAVELDAADAEGIPAIASDDEPDRAFVDADYVDGSIGAGRLGWTGEDGNSSWARYVLKWGYWVD